MSLFSQVQFRVEVAFGVTFFAVWLMAGLSLIRFAHRRFGWFYLLLDDGTASPDVYVILFILTSVWPVTLAVTGGIRFVSHVSRYLYRRL